MVGLVQRGIVYIPCSVSSSVRTTSLVVSVSYTTSCSNQSIIIGGRYPYFFLDRRQGTLGWDLL
jgi:hypothetical protein